MLTFVYLCVVCRLECPSSSCIILMSVPDSSRCVAKLLLSAWQNTLFLIPAFCAASFTILCACLTVMCVSRILNRYGLLLSLDAV